LCKAQLRGKLSPEEEEAEAKYREKKGYDKDEDNQVRPQNQVGIVAICELKDKERIDIHSDEPFLASNKALKQIPIVIATTHLKVGGLSIIITSQRFNCFFLILLYICICRHLNQRKENGIGEERPSNF